MKKNISLNPIDKHLDRIKYVVDYKINESARYIPISNLDEFDEIPNTNEADDVVNDDNLEKKPKTNNPEKQEDDTGGVPAETPIPSFDAENPNENPNNELNNEPVNEPQENVDNIQNDIIRHNIEAMKTIHSELENLNNMVQSLNSKLDVLNSDVEEVREPSTVEKLTSRKNVSYPYYFNLNDMWSNNWFNNKYNTGDNMENGVRELPDGTFIADFDDLPQKSRIDIKNSFTEID